MNNNSNQPIGIFDSGVGGLTVADAVTRLLPNETIIYFGDTAHSPWGDKSMPAIQAYSIKICDMLLRQNCKVILIACNTGATAAYDLVKEYIGSKALVLDVIEPVINHVREHFSKKSIGLIGTRQTVNSNVYKKKIDALNCNIQLYSLATPLLVPLIEEGFLDSKIVRDTIDIYLTDTNLQAIDALILACTHYPLIKEHIQKHYQNQIDIIDSSEIAANALKGLLEYHGLINRSTQSQKFFYVSDYTPTFAALTKLFFNEEVPLERYPLWD